jgi:hypothetical protein
VSKESSMSVFGPKYPPPLQGAILHAERFCELVADLEPRRRSRADEGRRWLVRRRREIATVLELVVNDWAAGRLGLEEASREVGLYLGDLHAGARRSLGLGPVLECCLLDDSLTAIPACTEETSVRLGQAAVANDTLFDPSTLVGAPAGVALDELTCTLRHSVQVLARKPKA